MCGRAASAMNHAAVAAAAGIAESRWRDRERYRERYNAGPGSWLVVMRPASDRDRDGGDAAAPDAHAAAGERQLQTMRWGLVRHWTPANATPDFYRAFNARSDTLTEKPMFADLLARKRCVVLLSAYYEWRTEGQKPPVKQPYLVKPEHGGVLLAAAVYDRWSSDADGEVYSFSILTKDASRLKWLHDREPVLLTRDEADAWLDVANAHVSAERLLQRVSSPEAGVPLACHPVSTRMSKGDVDDAVCMAPAKREVERHAGSVLSLFAAHAATPKRKAPDGSTPDESAAKAQCTAERRHPPQEDARTHAAASPGERKGTGQQSLASFLVAKPTDK